MIGDYKTETMSNNNCVDKTKTKVFINPKFNRSLVNNNPTSSVMHINPKFKNLLSNAQSNFNNKIHVNPYFMKSNNVADDTQLMSNVNINSKSIVSDITMYACDQPSTNKGLKVPSIPVSNSRYCLVRQNNEVLKGPVIDKPKNTIKVNKYKSIPFNDIKRNLDNSSNTTNTLANVNLYTKAIGVELSNKKYTGSSTSNTSRNRFRVVNHAIGPVVKSDKVQNKSFTATDKKMLSSQSSLKKVKGNLKKNNIPCPMFRKFGKCLRKTFSGNCEFLHDKKHVAVCRKFIKGLCHDRGCLLSHDLTTKKMPTCYFYLQGTCTKPDCPYLHVKISEKVKICPDFRRGYCENGGKCLLRHVMPHPEDKIKSELLIKTSLKRKCKIKAKTVDVHKQCKVTQGDEHGTKETSEDKSDCRYYQEERGFVNDAETCEIIKPTRCKLGTLPSYIQL